MDSDRMVWKIADILQWVPGRLANEEALGNRASEIRVSRLATLGSSKPDNLAFFFSREYEREVPAARPGILITGEPFVMPLEKSGLPLWKNTAIIACSDPYMAMAILSERFARGYSTVAHLSGEHVAEDPSPEIHSSAVISPSARIAPGARIGAFCVVSDGAEVGARTDIYPGCTLGPGAKIGDDCVLFPRVTVYEWSEIGNRVRVHAGTVIGADGFGYAPRMENGRLSGHQKIYHLGKVVIGDDVEIGANCTIDRATLGETRIGRGSKLDNDVHIAHNTIVGDGVIFCGASATAGGAKIGNFVYVGGMSGITNRVSVGDGAKIAGMCGVAHDVPAGGTACGNPQRDYQDHFRLNAMLNRMLKEKRQSRKPPENK